MPLLVAVVVPVVDPVPVELLLPVVPLEVVEPVAIELPVFASPFTVEVVAVPPFIDEPLDELLVVPLLIEELLVVPLSLMPLLVLVELQAASPNAIAPASSRV